MSMLIGFNHHAFYNSYASGYNLPEHDPCHPEGFKKNKKS